MKRLFTIILSFIFISYTFSDTIKYREKKLFRAYKDKVVTDVEFLGVNKYGVHYKYPIKYLGNVLGTIKCEDVYEIVDDNNNKIDYSCSDFTYDQTIGVIDTTVIQQDKRNVGGYLIAAAGIVGLIYTIDMQNPPVGTEKKIASFNNRMDIYPYMIYGLLTLGGIVLATDDKENINEKKTE